MVRPVPREAAARQILSILRLHPRQLGKLVLSLALGAGLLYTLRRGGLPLVPSSEAFAHVRWWTVPGYFLVLSAASYYRAIRWRFLLRPMAPISRLRALTAVLAGSLAVLLLPFRLGEVVRAYLVGQDKRIGMVAALGTVGAERIVDGLILSSILAVAMLVVPTLDPLPSRVVGLPIAVSVVRGYAWSFLGTFAIAFGVILVFHLARGPAVRITKSVLGRISPALGGFVAGTFERLADGIRFLGHGPILAGFLLETAAYWAFNALGIWLLAWGVGIVHLDGSPVTFGEGCAIMGILGISSVIPGPPGLLGLFQAGVYAALTMYFPEGMVTREGAAYVFLLYALQVAFAVLSGVASWVHELAQPVEAYGDETAPRALAGD
jgi:glycosyltransferase 2 family protein